MEFVLEHAALLERILLHLHSSMEQAYLQKDLFVSMMMRAVANVQQVSLGGTSQQKRGILLLLCSTFELQAESKALDPVKETRMKRAKR